MLSGRKPRFDSATLSLAAAINERRGIYWSRSRGRLWRKGETSGSTQALLRADLDCDRDGHLPINDANDCDLDVPGCVNCDDDDGNENPAIDCDRDGVAADDDPDDCDPAISG